MSVISFAKANLREFIRDPDCERLQQAEKDGLWITPMLAVTLSENLSTEQKKQYGGSRKSIQRVGKNKFLKMKTRLTKLIALCCAVVILTMGCGGSHEPKSGDPPTKPTAEEQMKKCNAAHIERLRAIRDQITEARDVCEDCLLKCSDKTSMVDRINCEGPCWSKYESDLNALLKKRDSEWIKYAQCVSGIEVQLGPDLSDIDVVVIPKPDHPGH